MSNSLPPLFCRDSSPAYWTTEMSWSAMWTESPTAPRFAGFFSQESWNWNGLLQELREAGWTISGKNKEHQRPAIQVNHFFLEEMGSGEWGGSHKTGKMPATIMQIILLYECHSQVIVGLHFIYNANIGEFHFPSIPMLAKVQGWHI